MPAKYNRNRRTGIRLVSSSPAARPNKIHLTQGDYVADVVVGQGDHPTYYYVLQRNGSADVLELERYDTLEHAREAAERALERWSENGELHERAS